MLLHLGAKEQAHFVFLHRLVISHFLLPRLHGEISLPQRDERLAGIDVLDYEVAGVAGERPIFDLALRARADADHIAHFRKMVGNRVAALDAGFHCFLNHRLEVTKVQILQHLRQIARGPRFVSLGVNAFDSFKGVAAGWCGKLAAHGFPFN